MGCAVYFNLDGTLTENSIDFQQVYTDALDQAGITGLGGTYEDYTDRFFTYFQQGWAFPRRQAILDVLDDHNIDDLGQSDAFGDQWAALEADETVFRPVAADVITALAERHSIGIVTNGTSALQRQKIADLGVRDAVQAILISTEIGKRKPNGEFFEAAQDAINADTNVVVSHDLRRDILPAKRAGMHTVWISADGASDKNQQIEKLVDTTVPDLEQVPDAVDELCAS